MIFKRYKIRRLLKRLLTAAVVLLLIFFVINILDNIVFTNENNNGSITSKQKREKKYNEPVIGDKKIDSKQVNDVAKTIENYYTYCNQKEYEKAYSIIDEECKIALYPSLEVFKARVDETFDKLKLYRYKNIANLDDKYVYKISLYDDVMAYGSNDFPTESYYYIVVNNKGENNYTISLNGFLKREYLNYKNTTNNLQIIINYKDIYYDFTNINYSIINSSEKTFAINKNDINLYYSNNNKSKIYSEIVRALADSIIVILPNEKKDIIAKFETPNIYENYKEEKMDYSNIYEIEPEILENDLTAEMLENNNISKFSMQIPL